MMKTALAAALIAGGASAANAAKVTYTFGTSTGSPYCDGIQLTETGGVASGIHLGVSCTEGDYAGGLEGTVKYNGKGLEYQVATNDYFAGLGFIELFTLNQKAKTWTLWYMSTSEGITFEEINAGELLKGKVGAGVGKFAHTPAFAGRTTIK